MAISTVAYRARIGERGLTNRLHPTQVSNYKILKGLGWCIEASPQDESEASKFSLLFGQLFRVQLLLTRTEDGNVSAEGFLTACSSGQLSCILSINLLRTRDMAVILNPGIRVATCFCTHPMVHLEIQANASCYFQPEFDEASWHCIATYRSLLK